MGKSTARSLLILAILLILLGVSAAVVSNSQSVRRFFIGLFGGSDYTAPGDPTDLRPRYTGRDADRRRVELSLELILDDLEMPTDLQFFPGSNSRFLVAEKEGTLRGVDLQADAAGVVLELDVVDASEQGLLGIAFHPDFDTTHKVYLNYTLEVEGTDTSRVSEWRLTHPDDLTRATLTDERMIYQVPQPYQNHNAGQLAFGPDGYLYIGWGDGGYAGDPHGHGQNPGTALGSMLRIDVDRPGGGRPYGIPEDNPFVGREGFLPETWAYGLRNPWRYSFDPAGRLVVADVGQNLYEEISIVERGGNYGWNIKEGFHDYEAADPVGPLKPPIYEYPREEGTSITGGFVYTGERISQLQGKYLFADFNSGRIWALELPEDPSARVPADQVVALGQWNLLITGFARDATGELYLLDASLGRVLRLAPAVPAE